MERRDLLKYSSLRLVLGTVFFWQRLLEIG
jgi:hypothetical protein